MAQAVINGYLDTSGNFVASNSSGQKGCVNETGTTAITGSFNAIQCLTDSVFSLLTDSGAAGDTLVGLTLPAGMIIYGTFTAFTLTSGAVRAYTN